MASATTGPGRGGRGGRDQAEICWDQCTVCKGTPPCLQTVAAGQEGEERRGGEGPFVFCGLAAGLAPSVRHTHRTEQTCGRQAAGTARVPRPQCPTTRFCPTRLPLGPRAPLTGSDNVPVGEDEASLPVHHKPGRVGAPCGVGVEAAGGVAAGAVGGLLAGLVAARQGEWQGEWQGERQRVVSQWRGGCLP